MKRIMRIVIALLSVLSSTLSAAELWVGAANRDITPDQPVALSGQRNV